MTTAAKPDQMHELDFLIGTWRCTTSVSMPGLPRESEMIGRIYPILDGKWYQWDIQSLIRPGRSRWVAGWNPAESRFTVYFYDNHGYHGTETSVDPGWKDGRLKFTGSMFTEDSRLNVIDVFTYIDQDCFHDDFYIWSDDQWVPVVHGECHRLLV